MTNIETGRFDWHDIALELTPEQNVAEVLAAVLRARNARADPQSVAPDGIDALRDQLSNLPERIANEDDLPTAEEAQQEYQSASKVLAGAREKYEAARTANEHAKTAAAQPTPIDFNPLIIIDLIRFSSLQFPYFIPLLEKESIGPSKTFVDRLAERSTLKPQAASTNSFHKHQAIPICPARGP